MAGRNGNETVPNIDYVEETRGDKKIRTVE